MTKSQAAALIAAAIQASKRANPQFPSVDRTAPEASRIALAKAECTKEAVQARYVAKLRALNLSETVCLSSERRVRSRLIWSEYKRTERAADKFDLLALCEFLHGDGPGTFTTEDDMTALCGYDYFLARSLEGRPRSNGLVSQGVACFYEDGAAPSESKSGHFITNHAILEIQRQNGGQALTPSSVTWEDVVALELLDCAIKDLGEKTAAKIPGMKPTLIQALTACDRVTLDAAVKKLVKDCGENRDICQNLVSDLWRQGFIKITNGKGSAQARVDLTDSGRHKVMTHISRKAAYSALDDVDKELS